MTQDSDATDSQDASLTQDTQAPTPPPTRDAASLAVVVEAALISSDKPLSVAKLAEVAGGTTPKDVTAAIEALNAHYRETGRAFSIEQLAGGWQIFTHAQHAGVVSALHKSRVQTKLSPAALETLAIIAYKQPLTRQEIEQIRGVDCAGSLKTLMDRRLVKVMGKKDVPGKPFLFGTSREFMETFSLGSLSELPSMRDIEDFLATSTGTPLEEGRPTMHLPPIPDSGIEQGGDELAASLAEAGPAAEAEPVPEGRIPADVTEAALSDAASKAAGEGSEPENGN